MPSARCLSLASSILFLPHLAAAQATPTDSLQRAMRLSWVRHESAASCPDAGHVEADVEQRLGWSPFVHSSATSESIEATVSRENDVWRAAIELRAVDGSSLGSREVESPAATCASLTAAAGLAIALMIEPLLPPKPVATPPAAPPPTVSPAAASAPATNTNASATTNASTSRSDDLVNDAREARGTLAVGVLAVSRILPRAALGVTLTGSTRLYERLFANVSASLLPEQHVQPNNADVGFGLTLGSIGPCYRIPIHGAWSISSCVSLLVGSLQIAVKNPEPLAPGAHFWWAASTGIRLGWNAGPIETSLGIDALAHITRHNYLAQSSEPPMSTLFFAEPADAFMGSLVTGVRY